MEPFERGRGKCCDCGKRTNRLICVGEDYDVCPDCFGWYEQCDRCKEWYPDEFMTETEDGKYLCGNCGG